MKKSSNEFRHRWIGDLHDIMDVTVDIFTTAQKFCVRKASGFKL